MYFIKFTRGYKMDKDTKKAFQCVYKILGRCNIAGILRQEESEELKTAYDELQELIKDD